MRIIASIFFSSILFGNCTVSRISSHKQLKEKLQVSKYDSVFKRSNIQLGELDKFSVNLSIIKKTSKIYTFKADVLFAEKAIRNEQFLYFFLCKKRNKGEYQLVENLYKFEKAGDYFINVQIEKIKNSFIIIYFEGWKGYLYE